MRDRELTKENCAHSKEWDYHGHKALVETTSYSQGDWNQTLMTRINNIGAHIYQNSHRGGPNTLKLHPSLMSLIETLEYYNKDENKVGGRFNVVVNDEVEHDTIYVYHSDEVLTIPIITEATDSNRGEIKFKFINDCTQEQIDEYIKSTQGYIQIIKKMSDDKELKEVICGWLDDYTCSLRSAEVNFQLDKNTEKYTESQFNIRSKIADMIISKCKREFKDE